MFVNKRFNVFFSGFFLSIFLSVFFSLPVFSQTEIYTWADLHDVRNNLGDSYILMNDLNESSPGYSTYNSGAGWLPIGRFINASDYDAFTGVFDGNGKVISGLTINRPTNYSIPYLGLFNNIRGGYVHDLGLEDVMISGGALGTGGLAGSLYGSTSIIERCYVTGTINSTTNNAGGIVGNVYQGRIRNAHAHIRLTATNRSNVGGVAGRLGGTSGSPGIISNAYASGSVSGQGAVGGLAGYIATTGNRVEKAFSVAKVNGSSNVGGLVGENHAFVINSFWDVQASGQAGSAGGTGLTTAEMKDVTTFTSLTTAGLDTPWDFEANPNDDAGTDDIWAIGVNNFGYPYLSWEAYYAPGSGDGSSPGQAFLIATGKQLNNVRMQMDAYFRQIADIQFEEDDFLQQGLLYNEGNGWQPIGDNVTPFTGSYDGDAYSIDGLSCKRPETDYVGLFGYLSGAVIAHVNLLNADIEGQTRTGGLAGQMAGSELSHCMVSGNVTAAYRVGGAVGYAEQLSGATGLIQHTQTNVLVTSSRGPDDFADAGGLLGANYGATISYCSAGGNVNARARNAGGLIGYNRFPVVYSYATGDVSLQETGQAEAGGLVGSMDLEQAVVQDCYATGNVMVGSNNFSNRTGAGGLVGRMRTGTASVSRSYATGSVQAEGGPVGGLIGYNADGTRNNVSDSFWDTITSLLEISAGGSGKDSREMKDILTFAEWDIEHPVAKIESVWLIEDPASGHISYPWLADNLPDPLPGQTPVFFPTLAVNDESYGTASDQTDASPYPEGEELAVQATANAGYAFVNWTSDPEAGSFDDDTAGSTTYIMPAADVTITANFEPIEYLPESFAGVMGEGSILADKEKYYYGEYAVLTAVPGPSQMFSGWSGTFTEIERNKSSYSENNPITIQVNDETDIIAVFDAVPVPLKNWPILMGMILGLVMLLVLHSRKF